MGWWRDDIMASAPSLFSFVYACWSFWAGYKYLSCFSHSLISSSPDLQGSSVCFGKHQEKPTSQHIFMLNTEMPEIFFLSFFEFFLKCITDSHHLPKIPSAELQEEWTSHLMTSPAHTCTWRTSDWLLFLLKHYTSTYGWHLKPAYQSRAKSRGLSNKWKKNHLRFSVVKSVLL